MVKNHLTYGKKPHDELVQYVENQNTLNNWNTFYVGMIEAKMLVILDTCGLKDIPALLWKPSAWIIGLAGLERILREEERRGE